MSDLKLAPNLFLEVAELNRLKTALRDNGYAADFKNNYEQMGIVYNKYFDPNFAYFQAIDINVPGSLKVNPGFAYDANRNLLTSVGPTLQIPIVDTWYWLKINYKTNNLETGTVVVGGSQGSLMTGTGTKFTQILRGQPNFPSKISFLNSVNYQQQYEILEIVDDQTAYVQGAFPTQEGPLQYEIVGTFTPGTYPPVTDQYPFVYDDFEYTFVPESVANTIPDYNAGAEFFVARVQQSSISGLIIQDKRYQFLAKSRSERLFSELPTKLNPLIAIESVTQTALLNKTFYTVNFQWGFRITQENRNYNTNKITVTSGNGGAYGTTNAFTTGDFDGWRYYYQNGDYSTVINSVKNGNGFDLIVDSLKSEFPGSMIAPNAEEIEIKLTYSVQGTGIISPYKTRFEKFYSYTLNPQLVISQDELDINYLEVDLTHRFKTVYQLTQENNFNLAQYSGPNSTTVLSQNIVLNPGSVAPPPGSTAWRGINPFCVLDVLGTPIYYTITTSNVIVKPTVFTPNNITPQTSVDETTNDLYVNFFSDAGLSSPVNITHPNLRITLLKTASAIQYPSSSYLAGGGGATTNVVQQSVVYYLISPAGVNTFKLDTVDGQYNQYYHPTQTLLARNPITLTSYTYASWPSTSIIVGNTGYKGFNNLEQYVVATNLATGLTKPNINTDVDYIAPILDNVNCNPAPAFILVKYFDNLVITTVSFVGTSSGTQTTAAISDTQNGVYNYIVKPFALNEQVILTVNANTEGTSNTSGFVWVRVVWMAAGSSGTTQTNIQIPVGVATALSQIFTNIIYVNISNF